jgi:hypothetical protein
MRRLSTRSFIRALIITVVSALIIAGGIYAYETLWSGKVHITIEAPASEGQLEVTGVTVDKGTWDDNSDTWTVSLLRGDEVYIRTYLKNNGGDAIAVCGEVNGSSDQRIHPCDGVTVVNVYPYINKQTTPADATKHIAFKIEVDADAEPGEVPEIELKIVK